MHAVLYGRPDGGKTMFSRVVSRSMFGVEQMIRGQHFTVNKALGLRDGLGSIPLIIDDVNRDRFTRHVPDLVKFDHEVGDRYAPILISTNREVTAVAPDLRKRMLVCHIDGARPRGTSDAPARRALAGIGTALYRAYLGRLAPLVPGLVADLALDPFNPPDLIRASSERLVELIGEALGATPGWAQAGQPATTSTCSRTSRSSIRCARSTSRTSSGSRSTGAPTSSPSTSPATCTRPAASRSWCRRRRSRAGSPTRSGSISRRSRRSTASRSARVRRSWLARLLGR